MVKRLALVGLVGICGCGASGAPYDRGGGGYPPSPSEGGGSPGTQGGGGQAGTLTAGAWDDNLNFDYYLQYVARSGQSPIAGIPRIEHADRMVIQALDADGKPLAGAQVSVKHAGQTLFAAPTAGEGRVLFFPSWAGVEAGAALDISAAAGGAEATVQAHAGEPAVMLSVAGAHAAALAAMDVALVIDTTGSMGDEIDYLRAEFQGIASTLQQRFPSVAQRWALVVYRDVDMGDVYSVRHFEFTGDTSAFQATLGHQAAGGGGDFPEAPERGLSEAAQLAWSGGASARLLFWVGDAPHHAGNEAALVAALAALRADGVHVYPVSASGTDELLEYSMRAAAEVSGGRYLFLTDDSGVGEAHKDPSIPCYVVTKLRDAMVRMASMELLGTAVPPTAAEIIRTAGAPRDGQCSVGDGGVVLLF